jgi:hypothetical protein
MIATIYLRIYKNIEIVITHPFLMPCLDALIIVSTINFVNQINAIGNGMYSKKAKIQFV